MHVNSRQVELDLEADVDVRSVNCRGPPKGKPSVWDLIQTASLCVGQLFEFHAFFKSTIVHYESVCSQKSLVLATN